MIVLRWTAVLFGAALLPAVSPCRGESRPASADTAGHATHGSSNGLWVATPAGVGPVRSGMMVAEARTG